MTLVSYIRHIARVRKPAKEASTSLLFFFDAHYLLANAYCQAIVMNTDALPRLVGPTCPPARADEMEEHALYKLMLFGKTCCAGTGACSDPLNYRCAFSVKANGASRRDRYSSIPAWRATFSSMTLRAESARKKLTRAERIPVIVDVSLCKTSYTGNALTQQAVQHRCQQAVQHRCC